jgi:hypothetical protein
VELEEGKHLLLPYTMGRQLAPGCIPIIRIKY